MKRILFNWPRFVFIFVPLLIAGVDAVVLVAESREPDTEKAIRLVRESNSRKENFTLQQYLYMTVYHRKASGEPITITGWRANTPAGGSSTTTVEFRYTDSGGEQVASWEADIKSGTVRPISEPALKLSWH